MESDGGRVPERLRLWSLSEDVLVEAGPPGDPLVAITRWGDIRIDDPSPAVRDALHRMSFGPVRSTLEIGELDQEVEDDAAILPVEDIRLLMLSDDGLRRLASGPGRKREDGDQD